MGNFGKLMYGQTKTFDTHNSKLNLKQFFLGSVLWGFFGFFLV